MRTQSANNPQSRIKELATLALVTTLAALAKSATNELKTPKEGSIGEGLQLTQSASLYGKISLPYTNPGVKDLRSYLKTLSGNIYDNTRTLEAQNQSAPIKFIEDSSKNLTDTPTPPKNATKRPYFMGYAYQDRSFTTTTGFTVKIMSDPENHCVHHSYQLVNGTKEVSAVKNISTIKGDDLPRKIQFGELVAGDKWGYVVVTHYDDGSLIVDRWDEVVRKASDGGSGDLNSEQDDGTDAQSVQEETWKVRKENNNLAEDSRLEETQVQQEEDGNNSGEGKEGAKNYIYIHTSRELYKPGNPGDNDTLPVVSDLRMARDPLRNDSLLFFGLNQAKTAIVCFRFNASRQTDTSIRIGFPTFTKMAELSVKNVSNPKITDFDLMTLPSSGVILIAAGPDIKLKGWYLDFFLGPPIILKLNITQNVAEQIKPVIYGFHCKIPIPPLYYFVECVFASNKQHLYRFMADLSPKNATLQIGKTFINRTFYLINNTRVESYDLPAAETDPKILCTTTRNLILCTMKISKVTNFKDLVQNRSVLAEVVWSKRQGSYMGTGFTSKITEIQKNVENLCERREQLTQPFDYSLDAVYRVNTSQTPQYRPRVTNRTGMIPILFNFTDSQKSHLKQNLASLRAPLILSTQTDQTLTLKGSDFKPFQYIPQKAIILPAVLSLAIAGLMLFFSLWCYVRCVRKSIIRQQMRIRDLEERIRRANENFGLQGANQASDDEEEAEDGPRDAQNGVFVAEFGAERIGDEDDGEEEKLNFQGGEGVEGTQGSSLIDGEGGLERDPHSVAI